MQQNTVLFLKKKERKEKKSEKLDPFVFHVDIFKLGHVLEIIDMCTYIDLYILYVGTKNKRIFSFTEKSPFTINISICQM
jgi:hypothetical protein